MSSTSDLVKAGTKLWGISGFAPGGATPKATAVRVQFTEGTGTVTVTVFSTNQDGIVTSGQMVNSLANTQSYSPHGGAGSGVPLDGPSADARNVAIDLASQILLNTMIPQIVAAGGTWP